MESRFDRDRDFYDRDRDRERRGDRSPEVNLDLQKGASSELTFAQKLGLMCQTYLDLQDSTSAMSIK